MARKPLLKRLPAVFDRLDTDGVLERYLGVVDASFDRSHGSAVELLDLRSVDRIPDRWLDLMGPLVGHAWRSDKGRDWNRRRIRDAIRRHSYKGTFERIKDAVRENGGASPNIVDMASKLIVWGCQGRWGCDDCAFTAADFWHEGAFVLEIDDSVDLAALKVDLAETLAAGERWYFRIISQESVIYDTAWTLRGYAKQGDSNALEEMLGTGKWGSGISWTTAPNGGIELGLTIGMLITNRDRGIAGGLLTWDSGLPVGRTDITCAMGGGDNPLPGELAVLQVQPLIV